jgi:hypothetical protein
MRDTLGRFVTLRDTRERCRVTPQTMHLQALTAERDTRDTDPQKGYRRAQERSYAKPCHGVSRVTLWKSDQQETHG